ncbi:MAG: hypothetical protein WB510_13420 [Candidatus Sulfotelmatobacter sp.]
MACPFFMPVEKLESGAWAHPARLPLGCGWRGLCAAPGHQGEVPSQEELQEFCNLGYAERCTRLPQERPWDAVRFAIVPLRTRDPESDGGDGRSRVRLRYVCERRHRPVEHGTLEFDVAASHWVQRHADGRVQQMAECFLAEYLNRSRRQDAAPVAS